MMSMLWAARAGKATRWLRVPPPWSCNCLREVGVWPHRSEECNFSRWVRSYMAGRWGPARFCHGAALHSGASVVDPLPRGTWFWSYASFCWWNSWLNRTVTNSRRWRPFVELYMCCLFLSYFNNSMNKNNFLLVRKWHECWF